MNTKMKRFWTDYSKNPEIKDPFAMWDDNWVDYQDAIEEVCGPYPGKCISHVPFDRVIHYACRDADATLRLWKYLKRVKVNVRRRPQENWSDGL